MWYCGVYPVSPGVVAPSMHASLAPTTVCSLFTSYSLHATELFYYTSLLLFVTYLQCIIFCCHNHTNWLLYPILAKRPSNLHFIALIYKHCFTLSKWLVPIANKYIITDAFQPCLCCCTDTLIYNLCNWAHQQVPLVTVNLLHRATMHQIQMLQI